MPLSDEAAPKVVLSEDRVVARGKVTATNDDGSVECDIWLERDGDPLLVGNATVMPE